MLPRYFVRGSSTSRTTRSSAGVGSVISRTISWWIQLSRPAAVTTVRKIVTYAVSWASGVCPRPAAMMASVVACMRSIAACTIASYSPCLPRK